MIRVLVGHVLDRLAELPAESVHCCVTSPPYYGLRDYGIEPQVWGGEDAERCGRSHWIDDERVGYGHDWEDETRTIDNNNGNGSDTARVAFNQSFRYQRVTTGFCRRCGAWRGSLGLEPTPALYIEHMVAVFREIRRVLRRDGTCWVNIGDSYAGSFGAQSKREGEGVAAINLERFGNGKSLTRKPQAWGIKPKDLLGIPWMLAFALRDDGWWLRSRIVWAKKAPMPESCRDRPTSAVEEVFLLTRSARYFYDAEAVKEEAEYGRRDWNGEEHFKGGDITRGHTGKTTGVGDGKRNMRNWWLLGPEPFPEAHFATFPTEIPRRAILAGSKPGDTILDPFLGAGTAALVADRLGRHCIGIELNPKYAAMAERRCREEVPLFAEIAAE